MGAVDLSETQIPNHQTTLRHISGTRASHVPCNRLITQYLT